MNLRKILLAAVCISPIFNWFGAPLDAATLEVGTGKTYATIQTAVDTAYSSDEIVVYAGTYDERPLVHLGGYTGHNLHIHAAYDAESPTGYEKVLVTQGFEIRGNTSDLTAENLIEGFYITQGFSTMCYSQYARRTTWKNLVLYSADGIGKRAAFGGHAMYGNDEIRHCTIYDTYMAGSYGYESRGNIFDSIIAYNEDGWFNAGNSVQDGRPPGVGYYSYTCWYDNPAPYYGQEDPCTIPAGGDETGNVYANPRFASLVPTDPSFLWISYNSPCVNAAGDGNNIGALPATEKETAALVTSDPCQSQPLPRLSNNQIKLVFSISLDPCDLPQVPLSITKQATVTDLAAQFTYSLETTNEPNDTLLAQENGSVLENKTWYHIKELGSWSAPFVVEAPTLTGDVDRNGDVSLTDYALLTATWPDSGLDLGWVDLDGDNDVDTADLGILTDAWVQEAPPWDHLFPDVSFTLYAENPIIEPGSEPGGHTTTGLTHCCVRRKNSSSDYMCWYSGDNSLRKIFLATSNDRINWTKQGLVLDSGSPGAFDEYHVHMPTVLWDPEAGANGLWKMWYTGTNRGTLGFG